MKSKVEIKAYSNTTRCSDKMAACNLIFFFFFSFFFKNTLLFFLPWENRLIVGAETKAAAGVNDGSRGSVPVGPSGPGGAPFLSSREMSRLRGVTSPLCTIPKQINIY